MKQNIFDENLLRSFLLGKLSENEQTILETAIFADADLLALAQTIEHDLIDEYVRDELDTGDRENFKRLFLNSLARRQKIEFAQTWQQLDIQTDVSSHTIAGKNFQAETRSFWKSIFPFSFAPQFAFAVAVVLLILGGGILFLVNQSSGENQIATEPNSNLILLPPVSPVPDNSPALPTVAPTATNNPAKIPQPNQNSDRQTTLPNRNQAPKSLPAVTFAQLVFPTGMTRDKGGKTLQLKLAPKVAQAKLVFNLESGDEYKSYTIEVRAKSGSNVLNRRGSGVGQTVIVKVSAARLAAGNYEAVLRGLNGDDQTETIGYYDFAVVKP